MLAINSILKNHTSDTTYNFYIVESDLSDKNKAKMKKYVEDNGQKIEFINVNPDVIVRGEDFFASEYLGGRISSMGMVRILLPDLLPESVHRVLYLDGDILVTADLSELYNFDLKENSTGMTKRKFDVVKEPGYNSGVILMDIDKWRKEKISKQMLDYINNNFEKFLCTDKKEAVHRFADQDLINLILYKKITTLPPNWNYYTGPETEDIPDFKGIYHYCNKVKPWLFPKLATKIYYVYYKYWNESPFRKYKYYCSLKIIKSRYVKNLIGFAKYLKIQKN